MVLPPFLWVAGTFIGSMVYCLTVMSRQNRWSVKGGALDNIMGCYRLS